MSGEGWMQGTITRLAALVGDLDAPTLSPSDAELRAGIAELGVLAARVEARRLAWLAELDCRPDAVPGAAAGRGGVTFLIHAARTGRAQAFRDVRAAHAVAPGGPLPLLGAALAGGEVSRGHVDVAARALERIPKRLLRAVDAEGVSGAVKVDGFLTEHCRRFAPDDVQRLVRHLLAVLDPDGQDRFDPDAFERRGLHTHTDPTGMLAGSFHLDPEGGATVRAALDHFAAPNPVRTVLTADGELVEVRDTRTRPQRDADALVEICRAALTAARDGQPTGRMPAHITVTATVEQLAAFGATRPAGLAECDQTGPVSSPLLGRLACDGVLHRVLTDPSGAVLDVGRTVRCATATQRKALAIRDGGCVVPGCRVPVSLCDVHHVKSWLHGGPTDLANLVPLCPRHHSAVHAGVWQIEIRGGLPWVIPPAWVDPQRTPLRNDVPAATRAAWRLGQHLTEPELPDQAAEPAAEPAAALAPEPAPEPASEPAAEPAADQPADQPAAQPTAQPTAADQSTAPSGRSTQPRSQSPRVLGQPSETSAQAPRPAPAPPPDRQSRAGPRRPRPGPQDPQPP